MPGSGLYTELEPRQQSMIPAKVVWEVEKCHLEEKAIGYKRIKLGKELGLWVSLLPCQALEEASFPDITFDICPDCTAMERDFSQAAPQPGWLLPECWPWPRPLLMFACPVSPTVTMCALRGWAAGRREPGHLARLRGTSVYNGQGQGWRDTPHQGRVTRPGVGGGAELCFEYLKGTWHCLHVCPWNARGKWPNYFYQALKEVFGCVNVEFVGVERGVWSTKLSKHFLSHWP